jgi:hypothetical protein
MGMLKYAGWGALAGLRLPGPLGALVVGAAAMAASNGSMTALGVTNRRVGRDELAVRRAAAPRLRRGDRGDTGGPRPELRAVAR